MSAVMWEVVQQRNIKHYGKLEEFVSMVTDAVPELMSKREGRLLSLGLRARVCNCNCNSRFLNASAQKVCDGNADIFL